MVDGEEELVPFGNFIIEKPTNEDTKQKTKFIGYDYMIKFNKKYEDALTYPIALQEYLASLCEQVGVELGSTELINGKYEVQGNPFTNNEDCKTVLSNIAQLCGGFAHVGRDNKLYITNLGSEMNETIDGNNYFSLEKNDKYGEVNSLIIRLSQVEGENTVRENAESIEANGLTEITIADNYFLNNAGEREKVIDAIFNQLNGLKYVPITCSYYGFPYLDAGDLIHILDSKDVEYPTYIFNHKFKYNGGFSGNIETSAMTKTQTAYKNTVDIKTKFQNVELKVDKINGSITQVISNVSEQNQKIAEVTQTVNKLNSKISDIADITTSKESTNATVSFEKINQSEPIYVRIYPTGENISYLYPHANLFPSETLYLKVRTLRFTNTTTKEYIDYELPTDLLYYDAENYDEFILDYDAQSCVVNKRVGYNADGTTYVLENPKTIEYEYPRIELTDGDYTIELLGYHNAYLFVRLMAQNIYTTQFATKAEMNSEIKQTVKEVDIGVNEKLSDYSTTTQMNAAINVKAKQITESVESTYATKDALETEKSERTQTATEIKQEVSKKVGNDEIISKINQSAEEVQINADKIDIDGKAARFTTEINETKGRYTNEDLERTMQIMLGNITATSTDYGKYDIDKDGEISSLDSFLIAKAVKETDGYIYLNGKFSIDPYSSSKAVSIYNNRTGEYSVMLGILNSFFQNLTIGTQIDFLKNEGSYISSEGFAQSIEHSNGYQSNTLHLQGDSNWFGMNYPDGGSVWISVNGEYEEEDQATIAINSKNTNSQTLLNPTGIRTQVVTQTSKESKKKNITKYNKKALDIVKASEIYEYNFKSEDDKHKKHIGFVIGDEGGEYKTPEQVISNDREGIENYSMTSILWKALQEQQELIEQLQNEIKKLKEREK